MSDGKLQLKAGEEARCEDVRLAMGEVLDGVADSTVKGVVQAHVRNCLPCAREMDTLKGVVEDTKRLAHAKPPPGAWPPIETRTKTEPQETGTESGFWNAFKKLFGK